MAGPFYDDGNYSMQILDVALGESSKENPQIVLRGKVIGRLFTDSAGEEFAEQVSAQYDRTIYLTVTEKSRDMVLAKLRNAGWRGERFESLSSDMLGRSVRARCDIELSQGGKYVGQQVEKWDLPLPPRESKPLENKPEVAKRLNALFGKALKQGADSGGSPAMPTMQEVTADSNEIPF